jgi:hypothetical protein
VAIVDVQPWLESLGRSMTAIQFSGPCGHGKTTHLLAIHAALPHSAYVYLPPDGPKPPIPDVRPLLIDEAQRLAFTQRRRILRQGGPLVLGTHDDLSRPLRRHGFSVVSVDLSENGSPDKLVQILNQRIEASRMTLAPVPRINNELALNLHRQWGANVRRIEQHLYDQFQYAAEKGLPWPPAS